MALSVDRPLLTFALFAYNQEQFIAEAVQGALSQTYSPLEIILSDDCSPDRTFEIMQEMASKYNGPNRVIVRRNERNLGLIGHINLVMEIVQGELIFRFQIEWNGFAMNIWQVAVKHIQSFRMPSGLMRMVEK
jgi:glycosyltransferase involved in cell wall biosynthesis